MEASGYGSSIVLERDAVVILPGQAMQKMRHPAALRIPLAEITGVDFRNANPLVNGSLTVRTSGTPTDYAQTSPDSGRRMLATAASLVVHFRRRDRDAFAAMRDAIEAARHRSTPSTSAPPGHTSTTTETGQIPTLSQPKTSAPNARDVRSSASSAALKVEVMQDAGWPELEVVGESYRPEAFRTLFLNAGRGAGGVMSRTALLVPEPKNEHDPNAVAVLVEGLHVGYLAREHAAKLSRSLRQSIAKGIQPAVPARIWAIPDHGTWRARVTLEFSGASGENRDFGQEEAEQKARDARAAEAQEAGKVRDKPFMWWRGDVADLKRDGRNSDALALLLECVEAAERVAQIEGGPPQQWPTEQAAVVYRKPRTRLARSRSSRGTRPRARKANSVQSSASGSTTPSDSWARARDHPPRLQASHPEICRKAEVARRWFGARIAASALV